LGFDLAKKIKGSDKKLTEALQTIK